MHSNLSVLNKQIIFPKKWLNFCCLYLFLFLSLQPLVGIIGYNDKTTATLCTYFYIKTNLVRGIGIISLFIAILYCLLQNHYSFPRAMRDTFKHKPWNLCFVLLLFWTIAMHFHSERIYVALFGDPVRYEGILGYFAYAGFFSLASLWTDKKQIYLWMQFTLGAANILNILSLYFWYFPHEYFFPYSGTLKNGFSSTFPQYNHYAYYLAMTSLLAAGLFVYSKNKKEQWFSGISLFIQLYTLLYNHTRGGFLGMLGGFIMLTIFSIKRKDVTKKRLFMLWSILFFAAIFSGKVFLTILYRIVSDLATILTEKDMERVNQAGSYRIILWKTTLQIILDHPVFGCGTEMVYYYMPRYSIYHDMPHNEYLQHLANLGFPGLALYLGALVSLFVNRMKQLCTLHPYVIIAGCIAIAYCISAFFGVTITIVLPFFYIFLGLAKGNYTLEHDSFI